MTSSSEPTDFELLRRWREGDSRAGNLLYRRHFGRLYSFCRARFVKAQDVDDVVQESFARALGGAERFRQDSTFRSYLFGIAKNVNRERMRKQREEPIDATRESLAEISGRRYSSILGHKDEIRRLFDALRAIPLDDQDLLEQFYFHELRVKDLAVVFDAKEGTIKSRLRLARLKLGRKYDELSEAPLGRDIDDAEVEAWLEAARPDALRAEPAEEKSDG